MYQISSTVRCTTAFDVFPGASSKCAMPPPFRPRSTRTSEPSGATTVRCVGNRSVSNTGQLAALGLLHADGCQVDAFQAAHVDAPQLRVLPRAPEGQDAAGRAEVIFGGARIPLVEGQVLDRREKTEMLGLHAMHVRTPLAAHGAVAGADVVEVQVDLEARLAAVTGALVGLHHEMVTPLSTARIWPVTMRESSEAR